MRFCELIPLLLPVANHDPVRLLVEDNDMNRDMLLLPDPQGLHRGDGDQRGSGPGHGRCRDPRPDPMDMSLPVIDGWEATRRLKADPATATIPVIGLPPATPWREICRLACIGLRRLRHQAGGPAAPAQQDPDPAAAASGRGGGLMGLGHRPAGSGPPDLRDRRPVKVELRDDLINPINEILGYSESLRRTPGLVPRCRGGPRQNPAGSRHPAEPAADAARRGPRESRWNQRGPGLRTGTEHAAARPGVRGLDGDRSGGGRRCSQPRSAPRPAGCSARAWDDVASHGE